MSKHALGATALQDRESSEPTAAALEWDASLMCEVAPERSKAPLEHGRDWPLAALIFGSAVAMYATAGFGIYVALEALVL